jgi:hypothetical protein
MGWWIQVQTDDIGRLGLELRVVGGHVALQAMGLEAVLGPHPRHRHVVGFEHPRKLACAPVRRTVGRGLSSALQDARLQGRTQRSGFAAPVSAEQPGQALRLEALAPARNKAVVAPQLVAHLRPRMLFGQQKDATRSARVFGANRAPSGSLGQFHTLGFAQFHRVLRRHDDTTEMTVTVH